MEENKGDKNEVAPLLRAVGIRNGKLSRNV
jgi:hypothetical protein